MLAVETKQKKIKKASADFFIIHLLIVYDDKVESCIGKIELPADMRNE